MGLQVGVAHEVAVYLGGAVAALAQAPDHKALAPAHIAAGKHFVHVGAEVVGVHTAAASQADTEGIGHIALTAHETGGNEGKLTVVGELLAGGHHVGAAGLGVTLGFEVGDDGSGQVACIVLEEFLTVVW